MTIFVVMENRLYNGHFDNIGDKWGNMFLSHWYCHTLGEVVLELNKTIGMTSNKIWCLVVSMKLFLLPYFHIKIVDFFSLHLHPSDHRAVK